MVCLSKITLLILLHLIKETITGVTKNILDKFTLYGIDIGPAEEGVDPPLTVVVCKKKDLALCCFTEKVYTTESQLLQFAKAEIGMKCESVKVYDSDQYNNTYDEISLAISVYNGQHVENQVIVFLCKCQCGRPACSFLGLQ